jgi:hypothetical protein
MTTHFKRAAIATLAASVLIGGGVAAASIPAPDGTITACTKSFSVYLLDSGACKEGWARVTWNAQGIKGEKGDKGDPGQDGAPGTSGTSVAYATHDGNTIGARLDAEIASKSVPAGNYVVTASINAGNQSGPAKLTFTCRLLADGDFVASAEEDTGDQGSASMALTGAVTNFGGGAISINCATSETAEASSAAAHLIIVKVDSIQ